MLETNCLILLKCCQIRSTFFRWHVALVSLSSLGLSSARKTQRHPPRRTPPHLALPHRALPPPRRALPPARRAVGAGVARVVVLLLLDLAEFEDGRVVRVKFFADTTRADPLSGTRRVHARARRFKCTGRWGPYNRNQVRPRKGLPCSLGTHIFRWYTLSLSSRGSIWPPGC